MYGVYSYATTVAGDRRLTSDRPLAIHAQPDRAEADAMERNRQAGHELGDGWITTPAPGVTYYGYDDLPSPPRD